MLKALISRFETSISLCLLPVALSVASGCCSKTVKELEGEVRIKNERINDLAEDLAQAKDDYKKLEASKESQHERQSKNIVEQFEGVISESEKLYRNEIARLKSNIEEIKKEHEDRIAKNGDLHRSKVAQLEGDISNLRLELGATQRERLAVQEALDRQPRIEAVKSTRRLNDIGLLIFINLILFAVTLVLAYKYRTARKLITQFVIQRASELRRIGAKP